MSEASGHQGLWTEAKYPGDTVRVFHLKRRVEMFGRMIEEFGSIRIQSYQPHSIRVGAFVPGVEEGSPGDTPKIWPEHWKLVYNNFDADGLFDQYVQDAITEGWERDYSMEKIR